VNNIHEKDWAEEDWAGHSGMPSNPYDEDDGGDGVRGACGTAESAAGTAEDTGGSA